MLSRSCWLWALAVLSRARACSARFSIMCTCRSILCRQGSQRHGELSNI